MSERYHLLNFRTMSYDAFSTNCPHFAIGCCNSFKAGSCKYKYHKRCDDNFLCNRYDCKFGHGITPEKRMIINNIYDEKYSSSAVFETSENPCKMPMNCINKDCACDHHLEYVDRSFIYKIVNSEVTDKEAKAEYAKKYGSSSSPFSDAMSSKSTISSVSPFPIVEPPAPPPMTTSFVALFKSETVVSATFNEIHQEQSDDEMTRLMNEMMLIRKDITANTKRVVDIKDQIKKMEDELAIAESEEKNGKTRLKELAIKIANFDM